MTFRKIALPIVTVAGLISSLPAMAINAGDLLVRGRIISIMPNDSSTDVTSSAVGGTVPATTVSVDKGYSLDIDFTYMITKNIGAELLLDLTSKHDVKSSGSTLAGLAPGKIIETRVLPPALILQYHFAPDAKIRPYAGVGVNYTRFLSSKATDSLKTGLGGVGDPKLDPSWGVVGQVGVDYDIGNNWFLNADLKYMKIKTTAKFTSGALGDVSTDVKIDPWVLGFGIGKRF